MRTVSLYITFFIFILLSGCKKFADIPLPIDQLGTDYVFNNDSTAIQSVVGIYSEMMNSSTQFSSANTTLYAGMAADELFYYTPGSARDEFIVNELSVLNHSTLESSFWNASYKYIYAANAIIEKASASENLSFAVRNMIIGEAKFIRAFSYFYLINLFGDVPLILSTSYQNNVRVARTSSELIILQMVSDLKDAKEVLGTGYVTTERVRPNKYAAKALLARVYLYQKDYVRAEEEASDIISSTVYNLVSNLDNVFLANSNEAIWQLRPVNPTRNTLEGSTFIPASATSTPAYLLTDNLINSFEPNDKRKISWTKSRVFASQTLYYPFKYKIRTGTVITEYYMVLRLAEVYLIRAEARAQQLKIAEAINDINTIRTRAGLLSINPATQPALLIAIEKERRVELFAEWGHRWLDINRTNRANSIMGMLKPATWQNTDMLWPVPQTQINLNPSLVQNPGY